MQEKEDFGWGWGMFVTFDQMERKLGSLLDC